MHETFISHLVELRDRLIRALLTFFAVLLALVPVAPRLYAWLSEPLLAALPEGGQMIATEVVTPFFVPLKVAMLAALMISLPYLMYQGWAFVAPGLYRHERRLVLPLVLASTLLFLTGMSFAYFVVFPVVFGFVTSVAPEGVAVMTDINAYLDFVITLFVAFGLSFQVPIVVVVLAALGMVSLDGLRNARPYVIVGAFIVGAVVTPPDILSQFLLAVPMWLLYEAGLLAASLVVRRKSTAGTEQDSPWHPLSDDEMERQLDELEGPGAGKP